VFGGQGAGGGAVVWVVLEKIEKKLKVKRVEDTIARPLCGCIYTAPDLSSKSGT
jgi:hypothetical protein